MKKQYLHYLIQLSDHLDKKGLNKEADVIDNFLKLAQRIFTIEEDAVKMLENPNPRIRLEGVQWIGEEGDVSLITKMLDDSDADVRGTATYWIGERGDINLITRMLDDTDARVRNIAISRIGKRGDINLLTKMLDDSDAKVRGAATFWIGERGDINLITRMLYDPDITVRAHTVEVLYLRAPHLVPEGYDFKKEPAEVARIPK